MTLRANILPAPAQGAGGAAPSRRKRIVPDDVGAGFFRIRLTTTTMVRRGIRVCITAHGPHCWNTIPASWSALKLRASQLDSEARASEATDKPSESASYQRADDSGEMRELSGEKLESPPDTTES